ncbi:MAG: metallophosphoesterase [Candidatus Methanomethylicia archaeon]
MSNPAIKVNNRFCIFIVATIFFINLFSFFAVSQRTIATDPIKYPLPSLPALCVLNGLFKVVVKAPSSATNWAFTIYSNTYGLKYDISYFVGSYNSSSGLWSFYLKVPSNVIPGLYSLKLSYTSGGINYSYKQLNSVYVFEDYPKNLLIAHLSDTHLPYGADVIARAIYELNLIKPSILVITGDFVDIGVIASAWDYAWSIVFNGSSKIPILVLPGNHDHSGDDAANYQKYCGPLYYNLSFGKFHFIAMDTRELGYVDIDQLKWAESVLKNINVDDVKIFLIHHPIFGTGFSITGSWQNINALVNYLYYTWASNTPIAAEFLRLVEQYNVRLVLAGHIHREQFNIYNGKHIFETISPAGGSLPVGVYWSFRLINVSDSGDVNILTIGGKTPQDSPSAYPIGMLSYYYTPRNDGSTRASSIKIYNNLEASINPLIEFIVNGSIPFNKYNFYPYPPSNYRVFDLGGRYLVQFRVNIPAKTSYYITLTSINDTIPPKIYANVVKGDGGLIFYVNATDDSVGIKCVGLKYQFTFSNGSKSVWYNIDDIPPKIIADKTLTLYSYDLLKYEYKLSIPSNVLNITYSIIAEDFIGNINYVNGTFAYITPKYYTLTIDSSPISGIQFTMAGSSYTTKFSSSLLSGNYTVNFPSEVVVGGVKYVFSGWSDGFTGSTRTILLNSDLTLTVYYKAETPTQMVSIPSWIYIVISIIVIVAIIMIILRFR